MEISHKLFKIDHFIAWMGESAVLDGRNCMLKSFAIWSLEGFQYYSEEWFEKNHFWVPNFEFLYPNVPKGLGTDEIFPFLPGIQ